MAEGASGAGSSGSGVTGGGGRTMKKCYYEVLEVERDASYEDIRRSYRRLALIWHPDKNLHREQEAKEQFQKIQQAYETLSNAQERAWYDTHREAVLREGMDSDDADFIVDLFPFFNSSCFDGFNDEPEGFYTVYRDLFEALAGEEVDAGYEEDIPSFGDSLSNYSDVVGPFYGFWEAYGTCRSFVWKDSSDSRMAGNRATARWLERENKKLRSEAKKVWNQQVRALVDFVKRRDRRYQAWKAAEEQKRLEREAETERKMKAAKDKRAADRKKTLESMKGERKEQQKKIDDHLREMADVYGQENSGEESEEDYTLYCPACNKNFRTEKAFENHEKSRRHLNAVEELRRVMDSDPSLPGAEESVVDSTLAGSDHSDASDELDLVDDVPDETGPEIKVLRSPTVIWNDSTTEGLAVNESQQISQGQNRAEEPKASEKAEKPAAGTSQSLGVLGDLSGWTSQHEGTSPTVLEEEPVAGAVGGCSPLDAKLSNLSLTEEELTAFRVGSEDTEDFDLSYLESLRKANQSNSSLMVHMSDSDEDEVKGTPVSSSMVASDEGDPEPATTKATEKKKRRRAVKKGGVAGEASAREPAAQSSSSDERIKRPDSASSSERARARNADLCLVCAVCNQKFSSRSKLFNHIRTTGHAVAPDVIEERAGSSRGSGGSGRAGKADKKKKRSKD